MADRFPILGTDIAPLIGREAVMRRIWNDLTKTSPSHLSVVGPRYSGKSVLLHGLAERMMGEDSPYNATILWDLGHQTPESDGEFIAVLCHRLGEGLRSVNPDYAQHVGSLGGDDYQDLREFIGLLAKEGARILMLWDGFDKPLATGRLTRGLWDRLRELASYPSLRLVTATRKNLRELIRSEESVSSDFWNIFDPVPVKVGVLDDTDREAVYAATGLSFFDPARTELENWTGGVPPLFLAVVNEVIGICPTSGADKNTVNQAASLANMKVSGILDCLWDDCRPEAGDLYTILVAKRMLPVNETGKSERTELIEKGLATLSGGRLHATCRMLKEYVKESRPDAGSMARLFGEWEGYRSNIRGLLERRLAHISRFDDRLYRYVELSISLLPSDPEASLNNLTSIEERALDVIWQRECGTDRTFPSEIRSYWTMPPRDGDKLVRGMMEHDSWAVPSDRGRQIGLLQLLTGSRQDFDSKAKATPKDTYVLINAIHSYRNRNQHGAGQDMHLGVAVAALMTCIELLACLDREVSA